MEYLVLNNNTIAPFCIRYDPCPEEPPCTYTPPGCYPKFGPSKD